MSAATQLPSLPGDVPPRKRFTRSDVQRMVDSGPFAGRRFELIDGDLIDKMGQNLQHAYVLQMLSPLLGDMFGPKSVRGQLPIKVQPQTRIAMSLNRI